MFIEVEGVTTKSKHYVNISLIVHIRAKMGGEAGSVLYFSNDQKLEVTDTAEQLLGKIARITSDD